MKLNDTYAVVDLEVSRPFKKGGEIIQFAVTFIKNWKIVDSFSTLINPGHKIDWKIRSLTGIDDAAVKNQPYFEEIAPQIVNLLNNTIFVAHNAPFDWKFLNESLQRAGFQQLKNQVIDTVELSQIVLPKSRSFKLTSLVTDLNIPLETNHHANDDADMTANLLIELKNLIEKFPKITLNNFKNRNFKLNNDNQQFLQLFEGKTLSKNQENLGKGIVVAKRASLKRPTKSSESIDYPINSIDKIKLFNNRIVLRNQQSTFMDAIYSGLTDPTPGEYLVINSPKYLGKTIGYLFPSLIEAQKDSDQIIIFVSNKRRRQHLAEEIHDKLDPIFKTKTSYINLGGLDNIVDLESISNVLSNDPELDKNQNLFLARLLIWLTDTTTGNFDDFDSNLNKSNYQDFGINPNSNLTSKNRFFYDAANSLRQSQIIILEHSKFENLDSVTKLLKNEKYNLIIDNAEKINQEFESTTFNNQSMPILIYSSIEKNDLEITRKADFEPL